MSNTELVTLVPMLALPMLKPICQYEGCRNTVYYEGTRIHSQSLDAAAEQSSENCVKIMLMLEYSVPSLSTYSPSVARVHPRADDRIGTNSHLRHNRTMKMFSFPWTNRISTRYCANVSNVSLNVLFTAWEAGSILFRSCCECGLDVGQQRPIDLHCGR